MPLPDIIKAVTFNPAKAVGLEKYIGVLGVGRVADITALKIVEKEVTVEDAVGNNRILKRVFKPTFVWRKGIKRNIL